MTQMWWLAATMTQVRQATGEHSRKVRLAPSFCDVQKMEDLETSLIDKSSSKASSDVSYEERAGDPGAKREVDLNGIIGLGSVHHLGDGHAGEGHPSSHAGRPDRHSHGSKQLQIKWMMGIVSQSA